MHQSRGCWYLLWGGGRGDLDAADHAGETQLPARRSEGQMRESGRGAQRTGGGGGRRRMEEEEEEACVHEAPVMASRALPARLPPVHHLACAGKGGEIQLVRKCFEKERAIRFYGLSFSQCLRAQFLPASLPP
eukprot:3911743-Rhodomonas_salina.1